MLPLTLRAREGEREGEGEGEREGEGGRDEARERGCYCSAYVTKKYMELT